VPSSFPTSNDTFSVPATPDTTPLSSAGTSNRNHTESHRDLGDAIIAIQQNVAILSHDHSGTGSRPTNKLAQANTHQTPDTDSVVNSLHHTLGTGQYQAAPGNHTHDSRYPQLAAANTFAMEQTFTGGMSVPNAQWAHANHTHESAAQGGLALPWKHYEARLTNATLNSSQTGTWDFTIPAVPNICDLEIEVIIALSTADYKFQQIDFTLVDITSGNVNILLNVPTWRRPTATSDRYRQVTTLNGVRADIPAATPRTIRVGAVNASAASTTTVYHILLWAKPFNSF